MTAVAGRSSPPREAVGVRDLGGAPAVGSPLGVGGPAADDPRRTGAWPAPGRWELLGLCTVLVIAALVRFAFLPTRGEFDLDQGHDMLVLRDFVTAGIVPLLGPPTSVGAGHHGAIWYYLLAPAALLNGANDPIPVVALLALLGVAAVALTWWLARSVGGPVAGLVAAIVLAGSATAIQASTFIWNPSPMAASSALAFAAARKAWRDDSPAWWLLAAVGAMLTMQLHWLGALIAPPLAVLWLAQVLRAGRTRSGARTARGRRGILLAGVGSVAIVAAGYLPLAIHEVTSGFTEIHLILDYLRGGGEGSALDPFTRILVSLLRAIGWPVAGPMIDAPAATFLAFVTVAAIVVWRLARARGDERTMVAWLGGTVAFAAAALGVLVASASVVTPLPTDHYHAWFDPIVAALLGIGVAALVALARGRAAGTGNAPAQAEANLAAGADAAGADAAGAEAARVEAAGVEAAGARVEQGATSPAAAGTARAPGALQRAAAGAAAVAVVAAIVAWDVAHLPPAVSPRGDWTAARAAADRIIAATPAGGIGFVTLPSFKGPDAYAYPLTVSGRAPDDPADAATVVVLCEDLWVADCGGPAEERALAPLGGAQRFRLVERLRPAPGRTMTILTRR